MTSENVNFSKSITPTPLYKMVNLSNLLGHEIYIKRDDLTGFAFGGNKTRKLDVIFKQAVAKGVTDIIALGGVQSNFCRLAAATAKCHGITCHLILGYSGSVDQTANSVINKLYEAKIMPINSQSWDDWNHEASVLKKQLTTQGKSVQILPVGGSSLEGALGYAPCFDEIIQQSQGLNVQFDVLFLASGSGGTQVGLMIGKHKCESAIKIYGVNVAKEKSVLENIIETLLSEYRQAENSEMQQTTDIIEGFLGEGYQIKTEAGMEALKLFAHLEGVILDTTYTAKAAAALIDYCKRHKKSQRILFLHTGGNVLLFK